MPLLELHRAAKVHRSDGLHVTALALGSATLASSYPAIRAAKLSPTEALRYE